MLYIQLSKEAKGQMNYNDKTAPSKISFSTLKINLWLPEEKVKGIHNEAKCIVRNRIEFLW